MGFGEFTSFCLSKWASLRLYVSSTDRGLIRNSNDAIRHMCCPGFAVPPRARTRGKNKRKSKEDGRKVKEDGGSAALPLLLHLELAADCTSWSSLVSGASWELSPRLDRTIVQSDCLAETTHCIITFTLWPVAGRPSPQPGPAYSTSTPSLFMLCGQTCR